MGASLLAVAKYIYYVIGHAFKMVATLDLIF